MTSEIAIRGVFPAALTPFTDDGSIHHADLERHLEFVLSPAGVGGVTVNGHAGEVSSLSDEEQGSILKTARSVVGDDQLLVAGVYAHGTSEARRVAVQAADAGADVLLVFPPEVWEFGLRDQPELAHTYYQAIAEASGLPLIAFAYPTWSALHLPPTAVLDLCSAVPQIAAVKEWSNDIIGYEQTLRGLRELDTKPALLSSFSRALFASLMVGADGVLSGHGSLVPDVQGALFEAVEREDLVEARRIAELLYQLTEVFYRPPHIDAHSRMKVASVMLGRISCDRVRGPLHEIGQAERARIAKVVPLIQAFAGSAP